MSDPVVPLKDLSSHLQSILQEVLKADWTDPLRSVAKEWEDAHAAFFASETDPSGVPWKPLSTETVMKKGHAIILFETGRLKGSLTGNHEDAIREIESTGDYVGLNFGTSVEYAMFHQFGTERMPQRQHVGINDEMADRAVQIIADHALGVAAYGPLK